jgi:Glycosyl hydrolase family 10
LTGPDFYTGRLQFTTPRPERIDEKRITLAHLVSLEGIPWNAHASWDGEHLTVERTTKESGALVCPWLVGTDRWATLVSASLMEREEPYCLPVELCRGVLHRLRERSNAWQSAGYPVSERAKRLEGNALRAFVNAAMHQNAAGPCDTAVSQSLQYTFEAMDQLLEDVGPSIGAMRKAMSARVPPFLGGWAGAVELEKRNAINLVRIPLDWGAVATSPTTYNWSATDAAVDAAVRSNRKILLGPLVRWTDEELPNWLGEQVKTFEDLSAQMSQYVHTAARRYADRAMVIEVADRVSRPTPLGLEPMQQLQLLTDAVRAANNAAPSLPRMVTIGLPYGETMVARQTELSPLHFADYLLRSEAGLSAIGLEIDCDDNAAGFPQRDPLDVAKLLERWAALGQPMLAILRWSMDPTTTGKRIKRRVALACLNAANPALSPSMFNE